MLYFSILDECCHLHYKPIFTFTWNCSQTSCSTSTSVRTFLSTTLFQILQMMVMISTSGDQNHSLVSFSKYSELLLLIILWLSHL